MIDWGKDLETMEYQPAVYLDGAGEGSGRVWVAYRCGSMWDAGEYHTNGEPCHAGYPPIRNAPETVRVHVWRTEYGGYDLALDRRAYPVDEGEGCKTYIGSYPVPLDGLEKGDE